MGAWVVWIFVCCRYWEENKVQRWSKERLEPKTLGDYPKKKRNTSRNHKEDPKPNEDGAKQEDLKLLTLLFVKEVIRLLVPSFLLTFSSQIFTFVAANYPCCWLPSFVIIFSLFLHCFAALFTVVRSPFFPLSLIHFSPLFAPFYPFLLSHFACKFFAP